jgi:uncharacterized protein (DUF983 family)
MNFETVCPTCGSIKLFYSRMEPSGWFCEECGTPTALTQATLDLEEPGNWS